jgi:hypothetical protein
LALAQTRKFQLNTSLLVAAAQAHIRFTTAARVVPVGIERHPAF